MGIAGLWNELAKGERIAFSKLAVDIFLEKGRPFRIAIDISIWNFQVQASQGGLNADLRTLYYRLVRLVSLSVQPLFVFDGPNKPCYKRNKAVAKNGANSANSRVKELIKLFGFPTHDAPGEAEAECAVLQKIGVVDAVLSEDVDTLMFGCGFMLQNWSSEARNGTEPTHITVYDAKKLKTKIPSTGAEVESRKPWFSPQDMILIALMSGGDYDTSGIPGCGQKTACAAAAAGFGESLCRLGPDDNEGHRKWRERLQHELKTNESKFFKSKRSLLVPEHFPDPTILKYYLQPIVSNGNRLEDIKHSVNWEASIDIPMLRVYVAQKFDWAQLGAHRFIQSIAPALLTSKLLLAGQQRRESSYKESGILDIVKGLKSKRNVFSDDGLAKIKVQYLPNSILSFDEERHDLSQSLQEDIQSSQSQDHCFLDHEHAEDCQESSSQGKQLSNRFHPHEMQTAWIPEAFVRLAIPQMYESWEKETMEAQKKSEQRRADKEMADIGKAAKKVKVANDKARRQALTKCGMKKGALDTYLTKVTKTGDRGLAKSQSPLRAQSPKTRKALMPNRGAASALHTSSHDLFTDIRRSGKVKKQICAGLNNSKSTTIFISADIEKGYQGEGGDPSSKAFSTYINRSKERLAPSAAYANTKRSCVQRAVDDNAREPLSQTSLQYSVASSNAICIDDSDSDFEPQMATEDSKENIQAAMVASPRGNPTSPLSDTRWSSKHWTTIESPNAYDIAYSVSTTPEKVDSSDRNLPSIGKATATKLDSHVRSTSSRASVADKKLLSGCKPDVELIDLTTVQ